VDVARGKGLSVCVCVSPNRGRAPWPICACFVISLGTSSRRARSLRNSGLECTLREILHKAKRRMFQTGSKRKRTVTSCAQCRKKKVKVCMFFFLLL
jgi:hypothetical protein